MAHICVETYSNHSTVSVVSSLNNSRDHPPRRPERAPLRYLCIRSFSMAISGSSSPMLPKSVVAVCCRLCC